MIPKLDSTFENLLSDSLVLLRYVLRLFQTWLSTERVLSQTGCGRNNFGNGSMLMWPKCKMVKATAAALSIALTCCNTIVSIACFRALCAPFARPLGLEA